MQFGLRPVLFTRPAAASHEPTVPARSPPDLDRAVPPFLPEYGARFLDTEWPAALRAWASGITGWMCGVVINTRMGVHLFGDEDHHGAACTPSDITLTGTCSVARRRRHWLRAVG